MVFAIVIVCKDQNDCFGRNYTGIEGDITKIGWLLRFVVDIGVQDRFWRLTIKIDC